MAYKNLSEFIEQLEKLGQLKRITAAVSPHLEVTEITDRISKSDGMALLFENNGTDFPILINSMGSEERICKALGINNLDEPGGEISHLFDQLMAPSQDWMGKLKILKQLKNISSWKPKSIKGGGACQEVIMDPPDLMRLPILTCWPEDGGPFITLPVVHTTDPLTGKRNVGMYRMQVFGPDVTGMHWHMHKGSARHYDAYRKLGKRMPVAVCLGGDPVYTYAATAPLPENLDEYFLAGYLRKKKVEMVKCRTIDMEVPADVDFVIEGYIDPMEALRMEGPFGDHTGFYSLPDLYPVFHITCITHRKNAVYPATVVGIPPQEDAYIGLATEKIFLTPIKKLMLPEICDMHMPAQGVFHNIAIVSIRNDFPGQAAKVMNALWGAGQMMFNKILLITPEQTDIRKPQEVLDLISRSVDPSRDLVFSKGPADVLDHSAREFAFSGKLGIDATRSRQLEYVYAPLDTSAFPDGVSQIREDLAKKGAPALLVFIKKADKISFTELHQQMALIASRNAIRYIIYFDEASSKLEMADLLWLMANHIDPGSDIKIVGEGSTLIIGVDATIKNKKADGFLRAWPNPTVMSPEIIKKVDDGWGSYGLGAFIPSPSLKYSKLIRGKGAIAEV